MGYMGVMSLPVRVFWLLNRNIGRIMAEKDLRQLSVSAVSQGDSEHFKGFREHLVIEMGKPVKYDDMTEAGVTNERDDEGFHALKMRIKQGK